MIALRAAGAHLQHAQATIAKPIVCAALDEFVAFGGGCGAPATAGCRPCHPQTPPASKFPILFRRVPVWTDGCGARRRSFEGNGCRNRPLRVAPRCHIHMIEDNRLSFNLPSVSRVAVANARARLGQMHLEQTKDDRLRGGIPHGYWKITTFVAGLRVTGMVAPIVLDGPINGDAFQAYVTGSSYPNLRWRHRHHGGSPAPPKIPLSSRRPRVYLTRPRRPPLAQRLGSEPRIGRSRKVRLPSSLALCRIRLMGPGAGIYQLGCSTKGRQIDLRQ